MFSFLKETRGASAIEYAFIAAFVVLAIVGVLPLIGGNLAGRFQAVLDAF
ncbi:MAG: Flp family type IVb pilin [Bdellovibrionales bacterium]